MQERHKSTPVAVSIRGLVKNYGYVKALQGLDLTIETGRIFCLLGPNGAGKTTLIKTIVGAVRPTSGSVHVLDHTSPGPKHRFSPLSRCSSFRRFSSPACFCP